MVFLSQRREHRGRFLSAVGTASLFRLTTLSTSCFSDTISPQEPYYLSTLQDVILVYTEGIMVGLIEQKITCILDTGMSDVTGGTYENTISEHPVYVKEFIKRKSSFCTLYPLLLRNKHKHWWVCLCISLTYINDLKG